MNIRAIIWKYGKSVVSVPQTPPGKDPPPPLDLCVALQFIQYCIKLLNRLLSEASMVGKENW